MSTVLIVGASRGIGAELARQYAMLGWRVHATTRSGTRPEALADCGDNLIMHRLDVRNADQIEQLRRDLGDTPLDVAIHAAGTYDRVGGAFGSGPPIPAEEVFAINTEAPIRVAEAIFENLKNAPMGRLVFISSADGIRGNGRRLRLYGESKAALNDRIRQFSDVWAQNGVIGIAMHPGWVRTEMGGPDGPILPEQSAAGIRVTVDRLTPAQCGAFLDFRGSPLPW
ncbi:SDR family NAD(P)-dependent oxidoreductase [Rhodovulum adriaticum]|uniref:Short-subunit dehydrogenase n=1 Tax=Rhodovulum adriaticum TaxID=35804 RepID=A0A4R2NUY3_RHOAD|nr:SDR family NAD(P)-dependent oxidoreductase [Rhodovulum adriaticum]MBK1637147.1 hypothetical protein [Rhodovulum adriaticum]TCP25358.1 short-subunit dehydrogenase [Rhodovulum adriaticum]